MNPVIKHKSEPNQVLNKMITRMGSDQLLSKMKDKIHFQNRF